MDAAVTVSPAGGVLAHIRSVLPSLLPTEQAVAGVFLDRAGDVVEMSSQQVADAAGASRATVVRTAQSLGFSGYQQLRVLLARDAGPPQVPGAVPGTPGARVASTFAHVAASVPAMVALLDHADVERVVEALAVADRIVVVGNGLSAPLAVDFAARLVGIGRRAEAPPDVIGQQVSARHLRPGDTLFVISGSGANSASVRAAEAARTGGATVVLVTAFARSPLTSSADISLVVGMPDLTFHDELTLTSRIPQVILLEGLLAAVAQRLGPVAAAAAALTLEVVSANLAD
ncbi:MurR/RpiR family transcriptional regulator [Pseudonocardia sp. GCM10023141]|uniref:MurR/RpiR family transcriptional regulator n=1 Tax=Pseudonocardia sp. GCM10023141 TaxID=3252653 RepID=UPI00361DD44E